MFCVIHTYSQQYTGDLCLTPSGNTGQMNMPQKRSLGYNSL